MVNHLYFDVIFTQLKIQKIMGCQDTFLTVHFIVVITNVTFLLTHCIATVLLSLIPVLMGRNI